MHRYYTDIIHAQQSHTQPVTDITPLMQVTEIHNSMIRQNTLFQVETRGSDGSYSRSFTQKTDWEKTL